LAYPNSSGSSFSETDLVVANLGARIVAIAPTYEYFRIARLHVYAFSAFGATVHDGSSKVGLINGSQAIAFVNSDLPRTGTPTTFAQLSQYEKFQEGGPYSKLAFRCGPDQLYQSTPTKWYDTTATGTTQTQSAGVVFLGTTNEISSGSMPTLLAIIEGVVEFRGMITPALAYDPTALSNRGKRVVCEVEEDSDDGLVVDDSSSSLGITSATANLVRQAKFEQELEKMRKDFLTTLPK